MVPYLPEPLYGDILLYRLQCIYAIVSSALRVLVLSNAEGPPLPMRRDHPC